MVRVVKKRIDVDEQNLLAPLSSNAGVGEYLRYEPIYDQIREARREDDDTLSQGIWQTDLKRADWVTVESLCAKALEFQSKDLQIIGWMTESWIVMDRFRGLARGLQLTKDLLSTYWQNIHPQAEDGDLENRSLIFDWMNENYTNRIMFIPLTTTVVQLDKQDLHLADWIGALSFETLAKRSNDYQRAITDAEAAGKVTLNIYRRTLAVTEIKFLQRIYADTVAAMEALVELRDFLESRLGKQTPTFARIKTALEDISRLAKTTLEQRQAPLEYIDDEDEISNEFAVDVNESTLIAASTTEDINQLLRPDVRTEFQAGSLNQNRSTGQGTDDVVTISGRKDAYTALKDIGEFLHTLDPHSPAPYILDMLVSWENKTLPEILEDLANAPTNTQMLIRMLASSLPNSNSAAIIKG